MNKYQGKIAVITGAASGIGKGIALRCADMGMKLALADIDVAGLEDFEKELRKRNVDVISSVVNVANLEEMTAFAQKTIMQYKAVDMFFNNAGVTALGNVWNTPIQDWKWVFDVNVMGLINGINSFIPFMMEQDKECIIVNTASAAGLLITPNSPAYAVSKHAAVALTEFLNINLQQHDSKVKAFLLCPGYVVTNIHKAALHRPEEYNLDQPYYQSKEFAELNQRMEEKVANGVTIEVCVDRTFKAIEEDVFYIIINPEYKPAIEARIHNMIQGKRPIYSP